jgi:putative tryptophan/tyrosine transport system substrate-binding protein
MDRRRFLLTALAGALGAPLDAEAQRVEKIWRVGVLAVNPWSAVDALRKGLEDRGYHEGRNVRYDYRWAEGHDDRLPALAAELVRLNVDVIVTWGVPATRAAKAATGTTPIVVGAADVLAADVVSSLARPGGNVTGLSSIATELEAKRLELLKECRPSITRVATLWNPSNFALRPSLQRAFSSAERLGLKLEPAEAQDATSLERALETIRRQRADALLIMGDPFLVSQRERTAEFAAVNRLPSISNYREYPETGGLMSYGPSYPDLFRRAAGYVDRIFRGAKPGDLPIELPDKFELVINVKTAKALGLTIPPSLLVRADQVIE